MKQYIFLDLDGTLVKKDTLLLFVRFLIVHQLRFLRYLKYVLLPGLFFVLIPGHRGNYKSYFVRYFQGLSEENGQTKAKLFYEKYIKKHLNHQVLSCVEQLRFEGYEVVLSTASMDYYVNYIAKAQGYPYCICTELEVENGFYRGYLQTSNCKGLEKLSRIQKFLGTRDCKAIVITDHHDDLPLIEWCDKAYVVQPTSKLRRYILKNPGKIRDISQIVSEKKPAINN